MNTIAPPLEQQALERLREQELEEARSIQSVMLPSESLRTESVTISHEFQPVTEVGGDFLDYFELTDGSIGLYLGVLRGKVCRQRCMRRSRWERCGDMPPFSMPCTTQPTELLGRLFREIELFSNGREQHDDMAAALFVCTT